MSKTFASGLNLQQKILAGVDKLADNVASTLGPKGRNVLLSRPGAAPIITKDGVTVANFVDLKDPIENAGAQLLKQVAAETNNLAGDGTTTSTVLAREILKNAQKYLTAGSSPVELKRGMDKACLEIVKNISNFSRKIETIEDIEHIATISANGDKGIGKLISTAVDKVGHDGSIMVEDAKSMETSLDLVEGFRFNSGYCAQAFVTDERKNTVEYEDALLFVTDHKIDNVKKILPVLELAARESRPLVIIADQIEGQALAALIMNTVRGSMKIAAIKPPEYGMERVNIMKDLCLATGATFFDRISGRRFDQVEMIDFGSCKKIEISKNQTIVMSGHTDWEVTEQKIESLKSEIKQTEDLDECRRIQYRITRLSSGIAVIKVGAPTEVEMIEKRHRIEDALEAVKAAQEEGIVPGGGVAFLRCAKFEIDLENEDQIFGSNIVRKSLEAPIRQMARNSGQSEDIILNLVEDGTGNYGYDFKNESLVDMVKAGIVDPAKVTRVALQNAISVASILITTNNAIVEVSNEG